MPIAKPTTVPRFASLIPWQASTYFTIGERITNDGGKIYQCDTDGTSDRQCDTACPNASRAVSNRATARSSCR